jgi:hypothetical protein
MDRNSSLNGDHNVSQLNREHSVSRVRLAISAYAISNFLLNAAERIRHVSHMSDKREMAAIRLRREVVRRLAPGAARRGKNSQRISRRGGDGRTLPSVRLDGVRDPLQLLGRVLTLVPNHRPVGRGRHLTLGRRHAHPRLALAHARHQSPHVGPRRHPRPSHRTARPAEARDDMEGNHKA